MKQVEMMTVISGMESGQWLDITHQAMVEAVSGELKSLLFDSVRESDIHDFVEKAGANWNASFIRNYEKGHWTIKKH